MGAGAVCEVLGVRMTNIPTDLLRTFVTCDLHDLIVDRKQSPRRIDNGAVFVREGAGDSRFGLLADSFAAALRPDAAGEVALFPPPRTADARYH